MCFPKNLMRKNTTKTLRIKNSQSNVSPMTIFVNLSVFMLSWQDKDFLK